MGAEKKIKHIKLLRVIIIVISLASLVFISAAPRLGISFLSWEKVYRFFDIAPERVALYKDSIHFLDVGEGDCTLIRSGDTYVMIDTGLKDYFGNVRSYLTESNITNIDYLVITHPHADHMGGAAKLISEFDVETIIMRDLPPEEDMADSMSEMQAAADEKQVNTILLTEDREIYIEDAVFRFYLPLSDPNDYNESSMITKITMFSFNTLIMADAGFESEKVLMYRLFNVKSSILRIGHHGSKYSTGADFLKYVNPNYAIISVGTNSYSHPAEETLERLDNAEIPWFRTDTAKGVYINFHKDRYEIFTNQN